VKINKKEEGGTINIQIQIQIQKQQKIKHKMEDKVKGAHGRTLPGNNARRGLQTIVI